jgi:Flp pilus assembly protein TadD
MKCYKCEAELTEQKFCTNCLADVELYKKIVGMSNFFYNSGLEKAKIRDLSGAIVALKQSLKFDKKNINARNLLGLVYFEIGEVTEALTQWIISSNIRGKKNMATEYIDRLGANQAKLNAAADIIKKYNAALASCKQPDGDDLGSIQLKALLGKAPNFLRARQLLALCYIKQEKWDFAYRELEKCRALDINNTTTLRYMHAIDEKFSTDENGKKKKKEDTSEFAVKTMDGHDVVIQPAGFKEKKGSNTILNMLVGVAIGFAIAFFLVLPASISKGNAEAKETITSMGIELDAKNLTIAELEQKLSNSENQIKTLTESLEAYTGTEGTLLSMENLLKAANMYLNNPEDYMSIADYIAEVDEEAWTDTTSENYKNLYYSLKNAIGPQVSAGYYKEGNTAFKNGQYEDAVAYLEAAVFFDQQNVEALYVLASSYRSLQRTEDERTACNKLIELFPGSWYAGRAEQYLKELE